MYSEYDQIFGGETEMRKTAFVLGMVAFYLLTGCASIVSKSNYPVTVTSDPSGATVTIKDKRGNDVHEAATPTTVMLKAGAGYFQPSKYTFTFEKDGCSSTSASLAADIDPWYIGNIIFGGLIGLVLVDPATVLVDPATGSMWMLEDTVAASLSCGSAAREAQPSVSLPEATEQPATNKATVTGEKNEDQ